MRLKLLASAFAVSLAIASTAPAIAACATDLTPDTADLSKWAGPANGPSAVEGPVVVAMVLSDNGNGGVLGVSDGVQEAVGRMGWSLKTFSGQGSIAGRRRALASAIAARPRALIINGFDAQEHAPLLAAARAEGIRVVGWHASGRNGPDTANNLDLNITTSHTDVACAATAWVARATRMTDAGVIILTDSSFEIAIAKSETMKADIERRGGAILEYLDVPISEASILVPRLTARLLHQHGRRWTHTLAINDIYFDFMSPVLAAAKLEATALPLLVSAGDGSSAAFSRIKKKGLQSATIAEPLSLQGWQIIDEINRFLSDKPWSGFYAPIGLITTENAATLSGPSNTFDPKSNYRRNYARIWKKS